MKSVECSSHVKIPRIDRADIGESFLMSRGFAKSASLQPGTSILHVSRKLLQIGCQDGRLRGHVIVTMAQLTALPAALEDVSPIVEPTLLTCRPQGSWAPKGASDRTDRPEITSCVRVFPFIVLAWTLSTVPTGQRLYITA